MPDHYTDEDSHEPFVTKHTRRQPINQQQAQIDIKELQQTFKGELQNMRQVITNNDVTLKQEVTKLIEKTQESEREKQRVVEELKKLREDLARQQDQKYEMDWEQISRAAHWTNTAINMSTINNARRKAII